MKTQLEELCEKLNVTITCKSAPELDYKIGSEWPQDSHAWHVTIRYARRQATFEFFQGAHTKEPSAADVLACVVSDARSGELSFEEFCSDLGYDADSRMAEKTWNTCKRNGRKVRRLLGESFEDFANSEH